MDKLTSVSRSGGHITKALTETNRHGAAPRFSNPKMRFFSLSVCGIVNFLLGARPLANIKVRLAVIGIHDICVLSWVWLKQRLVLVFIEGVPLLM